MEEKIEYLNKAFIEKNINEINRRKFGIIKHDCSIQLTAILLECVDIIDYLDKYQLEKLLLAIDKVN